jgi:3',5'-cyclic AMP phosphodiesterase CpdA
MKTGFNIRKTFALFCVMLISAITLTGLSGCGDDSSSHQSTASPQADTSTWSFAVTCDTRAAYDTTDPFYADDGISPYFKNVALALSRESGIDLVLFPGDLIRGKKPYLTQQEMTDDLTEWKKEMQPVVDAGIPVYYVRGNHDQYAVTDPTSPDGYTDALTIWDSLIALPDNTINPITMDTNAAYPGETYSFTHKGSLFLGIDEYADGDKTFDEAFVKGQLSQPAVHKFVFAHQPIWNYKSDELGPNSAALADDLQAGKADLFFSGHIHSYQRIAEAGYRFQEMIVGTGGAPQDDYPMVDPNNPTNDSNFVFDPNLTVENYIGGPDADARFGYVVVTVHPDGSLTSVLKILDNPSSPTSTVSTFDSATVTPE